MNVAGIDVGAKQLHVVVIKNDKVLTPLVFGNHPEGFQRIHSLLRQQKVRRVVLEATGIYHLDLALALQQQASLEVMVLNPKAAKHYASARMSRTKTDAVDATLLAGYAQHMPFKPWQAPRPQMLALRACSRRLAALTHQRTQAKNQRHAFSQTQSTPGFILEDVELSIAQLNAQIVDLEARTLQLIAEEAVLQRAFDLLLSVKGIGEKSAIQLLGELLILPPELRAKQWVAMAGLDPRHHQSGSSVDKKARISKAGNRYLRMALYMPALCAAHRVPEVHAYYRHLIEDRGLKKIQAVCAVMRKLLHAIHGMWGSNTRFDPTHFYTPPLTKAGG